MRKTILERSVPVAKKREKRQPNKNGRWERDAEGGSCSNNQNSRENSSKKPNKQKVSTVYKKINK